MSIVLAEDKKYYADPSDIYGGAETIFQPEDTQPIHVPIVASKRYESLCGILFNTFRIINFELTESVPDLRFDYSYLESTMKFPSKSRCVAVVGPLHSGKTSFVDLLVRRVRDTRTQREKDKMVRISKKEQTSNTDDSPWEGFQQTKPERILNRYTDTRLDERERSISVKSVPLTYLAEDSDGKNHLMNIIDTPGHPDFQDEVEVSTRLADGLIIVVDAVMGMSESLRRQLKTWLTMDGFDRSQFVLVISQFDRLILELRLPPTDAYFKLRHIIEDLNVCIAEITGDKSTRTFRPDIHENVLFASGKYNFCFSLSSFIRSTYIEPSQNLTGQAYIAGIPVHSLQEEIDVVSKLMWGDVYYDEDSNTFSRGTKIDAKRTFVQFVLEPLYKIVGACVSEEIDGLKKFLSHANIQIPHAVYDMDSPEILDHVLSEFFGPPTVIVDSIRDTIPSPVENAKSKLRVGYTGSPEHEAYRSMLDCDASGPLVVHCVKAIHEENCEAFFVLGRVYSGTLTANQSSVKILGESYNFGTGETEDCTTTTVGNLYVAGGRYRVPVTSVPAGNWVLIEGIDQFVTKSVTLIDSILNENDSEDEGVEIFCPTKFFNTPNVKIACEPLNPTELPKMIEGLRKIERAYPSAQSRVEESGEHVIISTGELAMDSILYDLRKLYGDLEIKLSEPVVVFNETCIDTSQYQCFSASPNKLNAISFIAEPTTKIEQEVLSFIRPESADHFVKREEFFLSKKYSKERNALLVESCGWDALGARNLWAFGPDWDHGTNILINDTLPDKVSKSDLSSIRESVVQGFQWAMREGPLVEEPVRNCKLKLLDAVLASDSMAKGTGQIIPTVCRSVYGALLTGSPRLLEPIKIVEIECPSDCVKAVYNVLSRRRGHVIKDGPKPGTPLHVLQAFLPSIDSFGFETDLRLHTHGQGFGVSWFDHWAVVPGDPLDSSINLRPLEQAPQQMLARDFFLKTRRRKGLSEEIQIEKYLDDVVTLGLARQDIMY